MAGLKTTQLDDLPVAFWTFDFDRTGISAQILDEVSNRNPLVINTDINGSNYLLEQQGLNKIELDDQFCCSIAKDGNSNESGVWLEHYFEAVHSIDFTFPDKGEFSVEWVMYKEPSTKIHQWGEIGYGTNVVTPLISKGTAFVAEIDDPWGGGANGDYLRVTVLEDREITLYASEYPVFDRVNHCVVTYSVTQTEINEFESVVKFYVNGRLIGTDTQAHVDSIPNTSTSASWLIGGNTGTDPVTDFATELLQLDQIAVYPYGLSEQQVANHYRKTKQYDGMIVDDYPTHYWRIDELEDPQSTLIYPTVSDVDGNYSGSVVRGEPGPDRILTSKSTQFNLGSAGYIDDYQNNNRYDEILNPSGAYALEFWFKTAQYQRGILFDMSTDNPNEWHGLRVFINSKNNDQSSGNIQISESYEHHITSLDLDENGDRYNFNDGVWHHIVMQRSGNFLQLWIDGIKHAETNAWTPNIVNQPSQITLMNGRPGDYSVFGNICEIAFYEREFQAQQIYNRFIFSTRYKVSGYTLLQGTPVGATVRFYHTTSGELVGEVQSNPNTGEYLFYPLTNSHLDIVSKLTDLNTVRHLVHGPVAPAEYDDAHIT